MSAHQAYIANDGTWAIQARCHDCSWQGPLGDSIEGAADEAFMHRRATGDQPCDCPLGECRAPAHIGKYCRGQR